MPDEPKNYYEKLGLTMEATVEDIRRAYLQLAKRYHPDYNNNTDNGRMAELNHVYEILSNTKKRRE